jgi:hypothetical protein
MSYMTFSKPKTAKVSAPSTSRVLTFQDGICYHVQLALGPDVEFRINGDFAEFHTHHVRYGLYAKMKIGYHDDLEVSLMERVRGGYKYKTSLLTVHQLIGGIRRFLNGEINLFPLFQQSIICV